MPARKHPSNADPAIQEAFRELWAEIDKLISGVGARNFDFHGRRMINAGDAVDPQDYVTLAQSQGTAAAAVAPIQRQLNLIQQEVQRITTTVAAQVSATGALNGNGTTSSPLGVRVDDTTIEIDGSNRLAVIGGVGGGGEIPVNGLFSAVVSTDPSILLGYGTWALWATGAGDPGAELVITRE